MTSAPLYSHSPLSDREERRLRSYSEAIGCQSDLRGIASCAFSQMWAEIDRLRSDAEQGDGSDANPWKFYRCGVLVPVAEKEIRTFSTSMEASERIDYAETGRCLNRVWGEIDRLRGLSPAPIHAP